MKAFRIRRPGNYGLVEAPMPKIKDDELLIKVGAAAICHSDIDALEGFRKHLIRYPNIPGHEFAGTVVEAGKSVLGFKSGDTVALECMIGCGECVPCALGQVHCEHYSELGFMRDGGFAEFVAVPSRNAHKFSRIKMEEAATAECAGNGYAAVDAADIQTGERVVIIGPGPVGLYALQFAKLNNPSQLIMVGTRDARLKYAQPYATDLVNVRRENGYERIMELTGGKGADVVLQCATTDDAHRLAFDIAGKNARIIIEGFGDTPNGITVDMNQFVIKTLTVKGLAGMNSKQFQQVLTMMEMGLVDPSKIITQVMPLDEIMQGFNLIKSKNDDVVKIVIKP